MCRPPHPWIVTPVAVALAIAAGSPAPAADRFVRPAGGGSACTQASPCALTTALATAAVDDTIYVAAGTYTGTATEVVRLDKTVTLLGGWDGAPAGAVRRDRIAYPSVLDGENVRRVVTITGAGAASPTVDGFTLTRGNATAAIATCSGVMNEPAGCGGGIYIYEAGATISNNVIIANVAAVAGSWPNLTGYGGGIYAVRPASLDIIGNTVAGNTASTAANAFGGGIGVYDCMGSCTIAGNRIVDNTATSAAAGYGGTGGGVALAGFTGHPVVVERNLLRGNRTSDTTFGQGDSIFTWFATFTIRGNCIWSGHASFAVYLGHVGGSFDGNTVLAGDRSSAVTIQDGGQHGGEMTARNNIVSGGGKTTVEVSALADYPLTISLAHNTIVGSGMTDGVVIANAVTATLENNIVAGHAQGIAVTGGASVTVDRTLLWSNDADGVAGTNAVAGDPMFVNAPRGDFHICEGSAAIGAGADAGVAADIDGEARPGAGGIDIGADERAPRGFDFGTVASPVAAGFTRITEGTLYTAARGYGWLSGAIASRDRAVGSDLTRDFAFTALGTFVVDVPNGRHRVSVTLGDATAGHGQMGVFLEGGQVASVTTAGNEYKTVTADVSVADGQLTVLLDDLGGSDPNVVVNALTVDRALPVQLDFGTASSPVASGYSRVTHASTYSQSAGHGWRGGIIQARDRGTANPLTRDFNFTPIGLLGLFLRNGLYDVTALVGDPTTAHDRMGVSVQGAAADSFTTTANQFLSHTWRTCVCDQSLGVLLADLGGSDANVVLDAITVREPPLLKFDFGTAVSPIADGYLQVTNAIGYTASRGYGWQSGTVWARDRGGYGQLLSDFNFSADATFAVDVLPGRYTITYTMGDAAAGHDQMGLYLEEELLPSVTVAAGQFATGVRSVVVTDGQLTVRLADRGGSDANAVINRLEIR